MMNFVGRRILAVCGLVALLGSLACENIALIKRPTPELDGDEIVGEITSIDSRLKEIHLRLTAGASDRDPLRAVRFDDSTQVLSHGREYPVSTLEVGDVVALQVWRRNPERSANLIRVQQSRRDRELAPLANKSQRIEGTVERIDSRSGFELRERSGATVIVSLSPNAARSVAAEVEQLHRGDHILGEGRYVDRERFELEKLF